MTKPIPEGFHTVSAYLIVPNAEEAMAFYAEAFGAEAKYRLPGPGGHGTMHAEMSIGDSAIMLSDENPQWGSKAPPTLGGTPVMLHLYVEDCDALIDRAVAAGCEETSPRMDAFWGDRFGKVRDPFGHEWGIATHKEDLTPEEIAEGAKEWMESFAREGHGQ